MDEINEYLKLWSRIFRFQFSKILILFKSLRTYLSLDINFDFLFDLYHNIAIHCLTLIDWLIFIELQDDGNLRLVGHWQNETSSDISVFNVIVEGHSVESQTGLIKIHCIFSSWDCQIDIQKCGQGFSCKLPNFSAFYDLFINAQGGIFSFFSFFCFIFHLTSFFFFIFFWLLNMESDFTDAIFVSNLIGCGFDDDIIFVDGRIIDGCVVDGEYGVVSCHGDQLELGGVLQNTSVINAFEGHQPRNYISNHCQRDINIHILILLQITLIQWIICLYETSSIDWWRH